MRNLITCTLLAASIGVAAAAIGPSEPEFGSDAWIQDAIAKKESARKSYSALRDKRCHVKTPKEDTVCIIGFNGLIYNRTTIEKEMLLRILKLPPGTRAVQLAAYDAFNVATSYVFEHLTELYPDDAVATSDQQKTR